MADAEKKKRLNVEFKSMPESLEEQFLKDFPSYDEGLVRGEPGGFVLTPQYGEHAEELYNFHVRPDDIWVLSFPKSGTTWTQELVWLIANDCDFEGAKKKLNDRSPFIEFPCLVPRNGEHHYAHLPSIGKQLELVGNLPSPRIIKTHLPLDLLPPQLSETCKVVYVARNPKDVIVSYFFHHRLIKFHYFDGDLQSFAHRFMQDQVFYSPYFGQILSAWERAKTDENVLYLFYEDLKKDLRGGIERVAQFLGKSLSEDQLGKLTQHLTFENLSKNSAVNKEDGKTSGSFNENGQFMRKGETGDWEKHFSPELSRQIDEWTESNLRGSDITFVDKI
ncbi:sulfotransferase 1 family member D1-like [Daphnia pulex]|uniref:sulfotransferase 1 family member D1-like n=1 Tax=Daphnia pulex TaxID=6669 RepID=UPI001EDE8677|nr:sulfotransferase 1 family member D1-like [Daphnia pulex]